MNRRDGKPEYCARGDARSLAPHPVLTRHYDDDANRQAHVTRLFDKSAQHYDRINSVLSFGTGTRYRRQALHRAGIAVGTRLLDVGTGCGCVAVACAVRLPEALVTATDVSQAALDVAQRNAERHDVVERIDFRRGDLFAPVDAMDTSARFDLILSNPPYVATGETVETAGKEPDVALFAGPQGTEILERLLDAAPEHLAPGGTLLMEIGEDQAGFVEGRARASFGSVTIHADLAGLPRMLEASSPS